MRRLHGAEANGEARASLAVEMFCPTVRKIIGAYLTLLGGADADVIGENAPRVRERVCADMEWCALALDPERNAGIVGSEERTRAPGFEVHAHVVPVDQDGTIA